MKRLKNEQNKMEAENLVYQSDHELIENLMNQGLIDVYGNPLQKW